LAYSFYFFAFFIANITVIFGINIEFGKEDKENPVLLNFLLLV
jgi:hypothetical protein